MNSSINKTFYTCSTESLFLRCKKISRKAVTLGRFLQFSVHIFLGHNLRILLNHEERMVNVIASYSSKTFSFEVSKQLLDLCLADSRICYFWHVLESLHKFIIELHVLQCLFVRELNKKLRRGWIISNFTKGETFSSILTTNCS